MTTVSRPSGIVDGDVLEVVRPGASDPDRWRRRTASFIEPSIYQKSRLNAHLDRDASSGSDPERRRAPDRAIVGAVPAMKTSVIAPRDTGRGEAAGVRIDLGGDDVGGNRETLGEELRRAPSARSPRRSARPPACRRGSGRGCRRIRPRPPRGSAARSRRTRRRGRRWSCRSFRRARRAARRRALPAPCRGRRRPRRIESTRKTASAGSAGFSGVSLRSSTRAVARQDAHDRVRLHAHAAVGEDARRPPAISIGEISKAPSATEG